MPVPAYVLANIAEIHDRAAYAEYRARVQETLDAYGGRFLIRGPEPERLEGDWEPGRLVLLEFPSAEQARAWWSSDEYREPKAMRQAASTGTLLLLDGYER